MNAMVDAESGCCMRQCCGPARGFVMHISDNYKQVWRLFSSSLWW